MSKKKLSNKNIKIQIDLVLQSYDKFYLKKYINFLKNRQNLNNWKSKNFLIGKFTYVNLPWKRNLYTVLRSPHVNKTARDQFEIRYYKSLVRFQLYGSKKNIKFFIDFLKSHVEGVSLKIRMFKI